MRQAIILLAALAIFQKVHGAADACLNSECSISNNCRCASNVGPLALLQDTPQLVVLAFVDAAKEDLYNGKWSPLLEPRLNPDQDFISASFYVPHEFSNYQIVHDLATLGFEIGVHSVTVNPDQDYWRNATKELLQDEFGSQRKIISKFANIPEEFITGTLTPQLQLAGDNSISAFTSKGFAYDNSWPSRSKLYPYTLDYASVQDCDIGATCPKESYPGFWVAPVVDLIGQDGDVCATVAGCFRSNVNISSKGFSDWLVGQIQNVKAYNRAPVTLIIEDNLFKSVENSWAGLNDALDRIKEDKEVFLVSQARVIEWIKNPVAIADFTTSPVTVTSGCVKHTCNLVNPNGEARYMVTCVPCPKNYPWLGNPEGN